MNTSPGYGTQWVHLGQDSSELVKRLGKPSKRRKSSNLREYWIYTEPHFEAIVSRKSRRLLSLFFHKGSPLAGEEFFGESEDAIRELFGDPQKMGGGITFEDGEFLGRWLGYGTGITFFFDPAGKVNTVGISARKRVAASKIVAKQRNSLSTQVAAFRRA